MKIKTIGHIELIKKTGIISIEKSEKFKARVLRFIFFGIKMQ